jgi:small-conductance mechanosensitive channel/CRP-like cAMP-binding protein
MPPSQHTPLESMLQIVDLPHHMRTPFEAALAVVALLAAFALRGRKWILSATSFLLLGLSMVCDALARMASAFPFAAQGLGALGVVLFAFAMIRIVMEVVESVMRRRREHYSTLFNDLLTFVLYLGVVMTVLWADFGVNPLSLAVTFGAVGVVLGLALQATLGDIFSGLALQLQKPFVPGDWVRTGTNLGRVQGIGPRSTTIITRANERLEVPNSQMAKDVLTNYQTGFVIDEIAVGISYAVPPNRMREVVLRVLRDMPHVLPTPTPEVLAWEYGDFAIKYRIKYALRDWGVQEIVRDTIVSSLWYTLRRHAIEIPFPIRTLELRQGGRPSRAIADYEREIIGELRQVDWMRKLTDDELRLLVPTVQVREFGTGEVLMRQGEDGESLYIIRRGIVEVLLRGPGAASTIHRIATMSRGQYVGEASLLLGEPRSATIRAVTDVETLEMDREGFTRLFKAHPEVADQIGEVVAAREAERKEVLAHAPGDDGARGRRNRLVAKMRALFQV